MADASCSLQLRGKDKLGMTMLKSAVIMTQSDSIIPDEPMSSTAAANYARARRCGVATAAWMSLYASCKHLLLSGA